MRGFGAFLLAAATAGCAAQPAEAPLGAVDLARFSGRWHVIAHMPDRFERDASGGYVEYRPRADGRMDYLYGTRHGSPAGGLNVRQRLAWVTDPRTNAHWKLQSRWPFTDDYLILHVSEDYRYALAGEPAREHAWVLAREPEMPEWVYAGLLARLAAQSYDVARLRKMPQ